MSIFIGSNEIQTVYVGSDEVQEIWVGDQQVWTNLPDISPGSWTLFKGGSLQQTLPNPSQSASSIQLWHNFVLSGSFHLNYTRATKSFALDAGSYRLHFTINSLNNRSGASQLKTNISLTGTTTVVNTLQANSTLTTGAKSVDFTVVGAGRTPQIQFESTMNTSGQGSSNTDHNVNLGNIYLEKL